MRVASSCIAACQVPACGLLRAIVAKTFPLERIADAQCEFLEKKHFGNFVLIPPPLDDPDAYL